MGEKDLQNIPKLLIGFLRLQEQSTILTTSCLLLAGAPQWLSQSAWLAQPFNWKSMTATSVTAAREKTKCDLELKILGPSMLRL